MICVVKKNNNKKKTTTKKKNDRRPRVQLLHREHHKKRLTDTLVKTTHQPKPHHSHNGYFLSFFLSFFLSLFLSLFLSSSIKPCIDFFLYSFPFLTMIGVFFFLQSHSTQQWHLVCFLVVCCYLFPLSLPFFFSHPLFSHSKDKIITGSVDQTFKAWYSLFSFSFLFSFLFFSFPFSFFFSFIIHPSFSPFNN